MRTFLNLLIACTVTQAIQTIRPDAEWSLSGNTYAGLKWLDASQAKPTPQEVAAALLTCQSTIDARESLKQQARTDVKNGNLTQAQRLQALLILLDYDQ